MYRTTQPDFDRAVDRLRGQRDEYEVTVLAEAELAGADWVLKSATWQELQPLRQKRSTKDARAVMEESIEEFFSGNEIDLEFEIGDLDDVVYQRFLDGAKRTLAEVERRMSDAR